ncbi:MAG: tryptophan-rich sensory protein [Bacteroidetes bacterium]|nr:tryptophan-rich sensory protein [Bacteroidota bacterium]
MAITLNQSNGLKLVLSIILCEGVGIISGLLAAPEMKQWLGTLQVPSWNPPSYLFGPVWTLLYFLMGVSFWLIWKSTAPDKQKKYAMIVFFVQLVLNFLWSFIFFNLHSPFFALINILLMLIAISMTMYYFSFISRIASWLLLPYLLWVCFATVLNFSIWSLNS